MKSLDRLIERVIDVSEDHQFMKENWSHFGDKDGVLNNSYAHAIYADLPGGPFFIHGWIIAPRWIEVKNEYKEDPCQEDTQPGFKDYLRNLLEEGQPKTFNDLTMLLTMFFSCCCSKRTEKLPLPLKQYPIQHPILDDLLFESKGFLIYNHQLENVIRLFERDSQCVEELVHKFKFNRDATLAWMSTKCFYDGLNLKDVVEKRMMKIGLFPAPLDIATRLYWLLFSGG